MIARLALLAAATLTGVAAVTAVQAGPAAAAACPKGTGVSVVVGGDVRCDADGGGKTAAANFTGVGHSLTYVTTEPGFVCQVDGAPSSPCNNTPPSSAYWALWWTDGTSGSWVYSNRGVGSLKVPAGGFVAFVFGNGKSAPGVKPVVAAPAPAPTTKPKPKPQPGSGSDPATSGSKPTPTPSPSTAAQKAAAEKVEAKKKAEAKKESATATPSAGGPTDGTVAGDDVTETSADTSDGSGSGALGWVAGAIALALVAGMGGMVWRRRTTGGPSS